MSLLFIHVQGSTPLISKVGTRIITCEPTELYNILQQATVYPALSDPNYLLLLDARQTNEYNESHILTSKRAPRAEDGKFLVPYGAELECKMHVVVLDNNTTSLSKRDSPAFKCAKVMAEMGSRNPVKILRGGYEEFSALYPFLRTQKILYMPRELDELRPYPVEVLPGQLYLGNYQQSCSPGVRKDLKIKGVLHISQDAEELSESLNGVDLLHCSLTDGNEADLLSQFGEVCRFIGDHGTKKSPVLVSSEHGLSRSASAVLAYLMHHYKWPLKAAYKHLQGCKGNIRPHRDFVHQLSKWEEQIFGEDGGVQTDVSDPYY
ncbi:serine/threonine/tyrosine-interacting-like protein 1 [Diadema antillarum]|uniref:serine/threonine/tyrosine-interacting-like protein 1 n=1 Tax=Diadema antillarum TaxID=105358 RepID=UPI003A8B8DB1